MVCGGVRDVCTCHVRVCVCVCVCARACVCDKGKGTRGKCVCEFDLGSLELLLAHLCHLQQQRVRGRRRSDARAHRMLLRLLLLGANGRALHDDHACAAAVASGYVATAAKDLYMHSSDGVG